MADNTPFVASTDPASPKIADDEISYSGDQAKVQIIQLATVSGVEGAHVMTKMTDFSAAIGAQGDAAPAAGASGSLLGLLRAISRDLVANIVLKAGSAIIGKVGIDQTTPGTTDSVSVATGQGAGATIGATGDAAVAAGATGSLSAKLRSISRDIVANIVLAAGANIIGKVLRAETSFTVSVAAGANLSGAADVTGYSIVGIYIPTTFDGTQINFQVSHDASTYKQLLDANNQVVTMTVTTDKWHAPWSELQGWRAIKINTVTAQATTTTDFIIQVQS